MSVARKQPLQPKVREKISLYCNVPIDHVISNPDTDSIYTLPSLFQQQHLAEISTSRLRLNMPYPAKEVLAIPFEPFVQHVKRHSPTLTIAITGKYSSMRDSYISITNALEHTEPCEQSASICNSSIPRSSITAPPSIHKASTKCMALSCPGGTALRGTEGMMRFIQYAREHGIPYLGLCLGFQLAAIEFARHVCGLEKATSTEFEPHTPEPLISLLPEQEDIMTWGAPNGWGAMMCCSSRNTGAPNLRQRDGAGAFSPSLRI